MKLFLIFIGISAGLFLKKNEATGFLKVRSRRANSWHRAEETKSGNLERECIEESCNDDELFEVYDNQDLFRSAKRRMELCREFLELGNEANQLHDYSEMDQDAEKESFRICFDMDEYDLNLAFEALRWMNIDDADFRLLVAKQITECFVTFKVMDMNSDGLVNIRELGAFLQNYSPNYEAAQLQYLFNKTDANGNGYIEFSDILTALSINGKTTRRGMIAQEMDADISQIYINGDGQINSEDFKIMLNLK